MKKLTYENVKKIIESRPGHKLISKDYKNNDTKLTIQCDKNHIFSMLLYNYNSLKQKCPICSRNNKSCTYEFVKDIIEKEGYHLLSKEYINSILKIEIMCNKNHIYKVTFGRFLYKGDRCPVCYQEQKYSRSEKEILKYVQSIYNGTIIANDRT